jgi:hypothetical protein
MYAQPCRVPFEAKGERKGVGTMKDWRSGFADSNPSWFPYGRRRPGARIVRSPRAGGRTARPARRRRPAGLPARPGPKFEEPAPRCDLRRRMAGSVLMASPRRAAPPERVRHRRFALAPLAAGYFEVIRRLPSPGDAARGLHGPPPILPPMSYKNMPGPWASRGAGSHEGPAPRDDRPNSQGGPRDRRRPGGLGGRESEPGRGQRPADTSPYGHGRGDLRGRAVAGLGGPIGYGQRL